MPYKLLGKWVVTPYQDKIEEIAYWAMHNLSKVKDGDFSMMATCPKVGYIGYLNGMCEAELAVLYTIKDFMKKAGLNWRDYFTYDIDSSG